MLCDSAMCLEYEQRAIDAFGVVANGYNINPVAAKPPDATGRRVSAKTRRLQSLARLGVKLPPGHVENIRRTHIGLKASPETRRKMSETRKGVPHS